MTGTYTFALVEVSPEAFAEVEKKLNEADHGGVIDADTIDMHGLALRRKTVSPVEQGSTKYRQKPVIVDAVQWFKEGDHAGVDICDRNVMPDMRTTSVCQSCRRYMYVENGQHYTHGWIGKVVGGHVVCPGNYIVTDGTGNTTPVKHDVFEATYDHA